MEKSAEQQRYNSSNFGLILDERLLNYHLGNSHPMNSDRIFPAYKLLEETFVDLESEYFELIVPNGIDKKTLLKAHDKDYVKTMEKLSEKGQGEALNYGLGTGDCPVWPGMAEASEFIAGSTTTSAEKIYNGDYNFSFILLGGLHHARKNQASGFCYYNDINVAIKKLQSLQDDIKILYLDTDLHHGDGTQFDFYNDPNVLTMSFHESGQFLFPGTGFPKEIGSKEGEGKSVNLPFYPYSGDDDYRKSFDKIVPVLFEDFQPDFVIWQSGVDGHIQDPLGHIRLTTNAYQYFGKRIRELAENTMDETKVLTLGGGGYNPDSVARSWTSIVSGLSDTPIPEYASDNWVEICNNRGIDVSKKIMDPENTVNNMDQMTIYEGNQVYMDSFVSNLGKYYSI